MPRSTARLATLALATALLTAASCGGGGDDLPMDDPAPVAPRVIGFSPTVVEYDFPSGTQGPRWTNETLTLETDPAYPGKVVVFFEPGTTLDPASFFTGGMPELGIDLQALVWLRYVPGVGHVAMPLDDVEVLADRVLLTPAASGGGPATTIPEGQYRIRVGSAARATNGLSLDPGPVHHSFFVGADPEGPYVIDHTPEVDAFVPASSRDVFVTFSEGIDGTSLDATSIRVVHLGALAPTTLQAAPGFPRLVVEDDAATLPTNGHVVRWRAQDPFPTSGSIRVTVSSGSLLDLNGLSAPSVYPFEFRVTP